MSPLIHTLCEIISPFCPKETKAHRGLETCLASSWAKPHKETQVYPETASNPVWSHVAWQVSLQGLYVPRELQIVPEPGEEVIFKKVKQLKINKNEYI